jgi:hypothetical protein
MAQVEYKEYLLMASRGEQDMMTNLPFLVEKDAVNGESRWTTHSHGHSLDPFNKLVKTPAAYNKRDQVVTHKKHHHGFYANLKCTTDFYESHKEDLDKYINEEDYLKSAPKPAWL